MQTSHGLLLSKYGAKCTIAINYYLRTYTELCVLCVVFFYTFVPYARRIGIEYRRSNTWQNTSRQPSFSVGDKLMNDALI